MGWRGNRADCMAEGINRDGSQLPWLSCLKTVHTFLCVRAFVCLILVSRLSRSTFSRSGVFRERARTPANTVASSGPE